MDRLFFKEALSQCAVVHETTSYLEILSYSDSEYNTIEEHPLKKEDFDAFIHRNGTFAPPLLADGVHSTGGIRLQKDAKHRETFSPRFISLKRNDYESMIEAMHLPHRAIETSCFVGPFFWSTSTSIGGKHYLQIIFQKSSMHKKGRTRGWELILSHEMESGITSGFCKGTPSTSIAIAIKGLIACASEAHHPLLMPLLVTQYEDIGRRESDHHGVRIRIHSAMGFRVDVPEYDRFADNGRLNFDMLNRDIAEAHNMAIAKPAATSLRVVDALREATEEFARRLPAGRRDAAMAAIHEAMVPWLGFYRRRLEELDEYAKATVERLGIQKSALDDLIARKESGLSIKIAGEQRMLAYASKHDSTAMKVLLLMGAVFLPGTYLSVGYHRDPAHGTDTRGAVTLTLPQSIMSTTFFDFHDAPDLSSAVSPKLWLY
ncbi:hypothetical protein F4779DRAFT_619488 [Xylariaceae sp. FL0662B]|nr:hypothetical protein F4779DRAFT_619488 [Xylariaceae sp. FL0662B]